MKKLLIALALTLGTIGALSAALSTDAAWLAKAKADYPLKTCIVSGEDLGGDMGAAVDYVYHQKGQPDRLVRICREPLRAFWRDHLKNYPRLPGKFAAFPPTGFGEEAADSVEASAQDSQVVGLSWQ